MLAAFVGAGMTGCAETAPLYPPSVHPVTDPSTVAVTVRYDEDLRNHQCTGDDGYISFSWTFKLGPPSIEMFDPVFMALFADVELPDAEPGNRPYSGQRDIIELHLTEFTGCQASWPIVGKTVVDIAYEAVVRSPDGREKLRWSGRGSAGPEDDLERYAGSSVEVEIAHLNALTSVAMRKAAADFVINYENDAFVRSWAER